MEEWRLEVSDSGAVFLIPPKSVDDLCDDSRLQLTGNGTLQVKKELAKIIIASLNSI